MTNDVNLSAAPKKRRKKIASLDRRKARAGWFFVLPFLIGFALIYLPMVWQSIQISFSVTNFLTDGGSKIVWVGFQNYKDALTVDPEFTQILLLRQLVVETEPLIPDFVENTTTGGGQDVLVFSIAVDGIVFSEVRTGHTHSFTQVGVGNTHRIVNVQETCIHGVKHFKVVAINLGALLIAGFTGQIVGPQRNILRRRGNRFTVGRREDVVGREHQQFGFHLRFV